MGRQLRSYAVLAATMWAFAPAGAFGQDDGAGASADAVPETTSAPPPEAPPAEEKRSVYSKKVKGWLWLEALFGVSSYDPDQFGTLDLSGGIPSAGKVRGPEFGGAFGVGLGGFYLGAVYRQANYDLFKLGKVGLAMQGIFRFIPYVHPMVRIDLYYATIFDGSPYPTLTNVDTDGGGVTLGAGLRVPVIRWISLSATFDWSFIGLAVRGDTPGGGRQQAGITGQQLGLTISVTFHFLGVRGD